MFGLLRVGADVGACELRHKIFQHTAFFWFEDGLLPCRYLCYLFFQLKTHADELAEGGGEEAPALSLFGALAMLTAITLVVATNSE